MMAKAGLQSAKENFGRRADTHRPDPTNGVNAAANIQSAGVLRPRGAKQRTGRCFDTGSQARVPTAA